MDGIFGWLGETGLHQELIGSMKHAAKVSPASSLYEYSGPHQGVAGGSRFDRAQIHVDNALTTALYGRPRFLDDELAQIAREQGEAVALAHGWLRYQRRLPTMLHGAFAFAVLDSHKKTAFLALDRSGSERLCYAHRAGQFVFGTSVQAVAAHPAIGRTLDMQAVYDYLYFHTVPAPRSIYSGIRKLLPGQYAWFANDKLVTDFYWQADYTPVEANFASLQRTFRDTLNRAVADVDAPATAAFLSGGTDSSTVVGTLTAGRAAAVDTFSIGFDAQGFDEMDYARCAAERYGSTAHEYYLKPADIVAAVPVIADAYDEPFGNSSAVPTYFCAKAAHAAGFTRMLAGDGGDEIFGGNARYAKQQRFEAWGRLPPFVRDTLIEPLTRLPLLSDQFPLAKLKSYVAQASIELPLRLETYNPLHRTPLDEIFATDFLHAVDPAAPGVALSEVYARTRSDQTINRLMHLDLKFTLADNDLRKVGTMTEAAGVEVGYPLLDDRMVALANRLPVDYKVRGQTLRWFFKEALRDVLPERIINKTKHGFGLPFGPWCGEHAALGALAHDSLADFKSRHWVRPGYVDQMLARLRGPHSAYYGGMVWVMMMLEQWLQANEA